MNRANHFLNRWIGRANCQSRSMDESPRYVDLSGDWWFEPASRDSGTHGVPANWSNPCFNGYDIGKQTQRRRKTDRDLLKRVPLIDGGTKGPHFPSTGFVHISGVGGMTRAQKPYPIGTVSSGPSALVHPPPLWSLG